MSASLVGSEMCIRDSSSSEEDVPGWGGSESEEEVVCPPAETRTVEVEPPEAARTVSMEVDADAGTSSQGAASACGPPAPSA
eukprot:4733053-Alexandrium_andersonii.AAC.1